jgi:hypothetical protein
MKRSIFVASFDFSSSLYPRIALLCISLPWLVRRMSQVALHERGFCQLPCVFNHEKEARVLPPEMHHRLSSLTAFKEFCLRQTFVFSFLYVEVF